MTKYVLPTIGLALLWGVAFAAQAGAGECCAAGCEPACQACGCNGGCEACQCCPHCGCKLVPVCHPTCTTKTSTVIKFSCCCKELCIPGVSRLCDKGNGCDNCCESGGCKSCNACDPCNNGCQDSCDCHCRVREIHKLMVCPVPKQVCVRGCTVEWVCPHCSNCGGCEAGTVPSATPAATPAPAPAAPAPPANRLPPAPKTTSASDNA